MTTVKPVLRRSHTKSKSGCQACKQRHVKCDEFRPTCHRCLSSKIPCKYPDQPPEEEPEQETPSLWWPEDIETACAEWKETGEPPFISLAPSPSWHNMDMKDLRYIYKMALVSNILELSNTNDICLLWGEMGVLFQLATQFDFVAHTLAATSAQRLAVTTKSHEASLDAHQYRKQALHGLYRAMGSFSKDNSDAILAASLGCSYIMSDSRSLMTLAGNISTVANRMRPWLKRSAFHRIFTYEPPYLDNEEQAAATPPETGDVEHRFALVKKLLAEGVNSVNGLAFCFQGDRDLSAVLRQLRDVMRLVHERLGSDITTEDQYRLVYPFTAWFVKSPAASFVSLSKKNPYMLVFLLHMYAVVVTLTTALPRIDVPLFAKYRLRAILQICNILKNDPGFLCQRCNGFHAYQEIMSFPLNSVSAYQQLGREKAFLGA
ncbi:uncharacterized protein TrAFT101_010638 [Trichoderma asperellum]|uniref:Zn(2)-C6 fungal-type domain-containing protein n=1 Tax=Trichoderma asperellum (strain ATCC 204424 / CBS 433.97 / NBRC 101777) TaxID=1042311 RepID=A0A2T3YT91_TRIA4|nr:hypothetical protein M441DRAFT_62528 [Trichoderma asperellum CBS 433.97]PTB35792.1 hypothetical protein M441DRAFT_62528 [Trichoderma asperellum CBS 433.97]UKZ95824.1 hypothetical protein TrAFT101_010638 [Trichoderma asperellum]